MGLRMGRCTKCCALLNTSTSDPVVARSKTLVCGRWPAGIADSNPARGVDVCVVCVVQEGQKAKARTGRAKKDG